MKQHHADPRCDIGLVGCLTEAELFDGSSYRRARQPVHVKSLCEQFGLDETISNDEAAAAYAAVTDAFLASKMKWEGWKAYVSLVHKTLTQYHASAILGTFVELHAYIKLD